MNKVVLSERLMALAKESGVPGKRRSAAAGMVALAKELVGAGKKSAAGAKGAV